jgi:ankyrin repeat protein
MKEQINDLKDTIPNNIKESLLQSLSINRPETANSAKTLGCELLNQAASNNNAYWMRDLIGCGVDINFAEKNGMTPLLYAVEALGYEAVKLLLENGADVNAKYHDGTNASMYIQTLINGNLHGIDAASLESLSVLIKHYLDLEMDALGAAQANDF